MNPWSFFFIGYVFSQPLRLRRVAQATFFHSAAVRSARSVFIVWKRSFLYDKKTAGAFEKAAGGLYRLQAAASDYFTVIAVIWGFTPSYQYRKPSASMVSPICRFLTAL